MKRLLAVAALLSSATYGAIGMLPGVRDEPSARRDTGKQVPRDKIHSDETDSVGPQTSVARFALPFFTTARRSRQNARGSWQDSKPLGSTSKSSHPRCQAINPTIIVSVNVEEPFGKRDQRASYNAEKCAYYRKQGWKMENPMYVEEPGWIEISNDYGRGKLPLRLQSIDPFVLSRGKRIRRLKNGATDAARADRIHTNYHYSRKETNFLSYPSYTRPMRSNEPNRVFTGKMTRAQTKRDSSTANEASARREKSRTLERRNQRLVILDVLEQPYFISRGKKAEHPYRTNLDTSLLNEQDERNKSKVQLLWDDRDGPIPST